MERTPTQLGRLMKAAVAFYKAEEEWCNSDDDAALYEAFDDAREDLFKAARVWGEGQ